MSHPQISVIILNYNFGKYIGECIDSILAQTLPPYEIIICDDCSQDNSWDVITGYQDQYQNLIKAFRHEQNLGISHNAQFSFNQTSGELVSRLSGDDLWLPQKLELEWQALQRITEARIAYSNIYTISPEGNLTGIYYDGSGKPPPEGDVFLKVYSRRFFQNTKNIFRNPLIYRKSWEETGDCDLNLRSYMDWDLRIRLTSRYQVAYSGEALVIYRQHPGGISRSNPVMNYHAMVAVYEKHLYVLSQMSLLDQIQVRCNIESIFTFRQLNLPASDQLDRYSALAVFNRNLILLEKLPESERDKLDSGATNQFLLVSLRLSRDEILKGHFKSAFRYYKTFRRFNNKQLNPKRVAQTLLPRLYNFGKKSKKQLFRNRCPKILYSRSTINHQ